MTEANYVKCFVFNETKLKVRLSRKTNFKHFWVNFLQEVALWVSWLNLFLKNEFRAFDPWPRCHQVKSIYFFFKPASHVSVAYLSKGGETVVHRVVPLLVHEAGVSPGVVTVVCQCQRPGTEPGVTMIMTR